MLTLFVEAFEDGLRDTFDSDWRGWGALDVDLLGYYEEEHARVPFAEVGVMFMPLYGQKSLAMSIWDGDSEQATGQLMRENGQLARINPRERKLWGELSAYAANKRNKGLVRHLLKELSTVPVDAVLFDPDDPLEATGSDA